MGGTGGGIVYNEEELKIIGARGIAASMVGQILIEEAVIGWEELELEVVRYEKNNMITVCFIENVDPMGTHTGDSFVLHQCLLYQKSSKKRCKTSLTKSSKQSELLEGQMYNGHIILKMTG